MLKKESKIFITGAAGLVGSAIASKLKSLGFYNIISPGRNQIDLRDQKAVFDFFKIQKPEIVFHAAAKVGGILANNNYRSDFIYDNLAISLNVIKAAADNGVEKLINLGSSCVYPKNPPQPIREEYLLSGYLEPTNEPYAIAKIAALKLCSAFNNSLGTNFITLMPTNLYGENDNFNLETAHVLPALVRKIILAKLLNENNFQLIYKDFQLHTPGFGLNNSGSDKVSIEFILDRLGITENHIIIWGTGKPLREFMHTRDLADACVYFAENFNADTTGDLINIGSGEEISIENLALLIKEIVGFNGSIVYDTSKPDGTPKKFLDTSKAAKLGWKACIKLNAGLENLIAHYFKQLIG